MSTALSSSRRQVMAISIEAIAIASSLGNCEGTAPVARGGGGGGGAAAAGPALQALRALADRVLALSGGGEGGEGARRATESSGGADIRTPRLPPLTLRTLDVAGYSPAVDDLREAAETCGGRRYQFDPLLLVLHERLQESIAASGETGGEPPPLRLCVAGGDGTLHRLCQAYAVLQCAYPQLCSRVPLQVFLLPLGLRGRNRLAQFIASQDGWYRRHIYAPHVGGPPTVPHLILPHQSRHAWEDGSDASGGPPSAQLGSMDLGSSGSSSGLAGGDGGQGAYGRGASSITLPDAPLRRTLTEYFRSARSTLPVVLFEVACWLTPPADTPASSRAGSQGSQVPTAAAAATAGCGASGMATSSARPGEAPFITIVFSSSVEVVAAADRPLVEQSMSNVSSAAREGSLNKDGGVPLSVTYQMADPWGVAYTQLTSLAARFSSLSLHTFSDEPPLHFPSSGRLQMRASVTAARTRSPCRYITTATISAGREATATARPAPVDSDRPAGGSLARMPSRQQQLAAPATERFGLFVDGEYYGPFAYAQVSPCCVPGQSEPISLPLGTFFAMDDGGLRELD